MIKLTLKHLIDNDFTTDLQEVTNLKLPRKLAYSLSKIYYEVQKLGKKELPNFDKKRVELLKKYSDKDEKNEPVTKNGKFQLNEENQQLFTDEIEKLQEKEFEINREPVDVTAFPQDAFSGAMLHSLQPIMCGFEKIQ